ncbi:MAG: magnesium transporter, partial [Oscillospiraceae bacterium]|nr:magnesium transporter [Candidatus Equicaccousia limihippi]
MNETFDFESFKELAVQKDYRKLRDLLVEENEVDIAEFLEELDEKQRAVVFRILPKEIAADVFSNLTPETQRIIISAITDKELSVIIEDLFVDDAVDMLEDMPANVVKRVLKSASPDTRRIINQFLKYPENTAGSIMTAEFIDLKKDMTVKEAIERIRKTGEESETIYTCYVIDRRRILLGIVTVKELLLNADDAVISDIMETDIICAKTTDDQEEVGQTMMKYDLISLPVTDAENRLVGIVTVDDVMDVMEEEATEDIEKMAAISPSDRPYFQTGVFETFRSRIPWLLLLMISATFTGAIISSFEAKLAMFTGLIAFIPMLMDTGGNSGSQSSVTVIRAISLGDIEFNDIFKVIWKEQRVAFLCSATLAVINGIKLYFVDYLLLHSLDLEKAIPEILVVCLTLFCTVVVAKLVGCTLPVVAKRLGVDPAVLGSAFITTIVDAISR